MRFARFFSELKRRRVYQVAAAYVVAGFAILEAADLVLPVLPAPPWLYRALVILLLAGFPVVVILAWVFDITPDGVRRDGATDTPTDSEVESTPGAWAGRPLMVATLLVGVVGVAAWIAGRSTAGPASIDRSATLAVAPFAPAGPDSALQRLGREMVITLSSALAGTADLDVVEPLTVLANVRPESGPLTLEQAGELAASTGAGHVLYGGLLRSGDDVRVEVGLYEIPGLRRLGIQAITAEHVDALTDSATLAALRLIWREAGSAPPSPGAVSTGSLEALQAYLDGERAIAEGRWREAPEHFARAVAADSSFWFAYWRLQYALQYHGSPVDSVVTARVWEHRRQLPERDRLLIEASAAQPGRSIELLRDATTRFPTYWPAWWALAEKYVHHGGYLGHRLSESRAALERTVALNPRFVTAWAHLFWTATAMRDSAAMGRIIDELSSARYDRVTLEESGINTLDFYHAQYALVAAGGEVPASVVEKGVSELSSFRGPGEPETLASGLTNRGFLEAQIRMSRAILQRHTAAPPMERAQHLVLAHAWAGRGVWDSATVAADTYAASAMRLDDLVLPYQIAVVGAWAGAVDPDRARTRRPGPRTPVHSEPDLAAETAWLDGLLALTLGDGEALSRARVGLAASGGRWREVLDRSLAAFGTAIAGDTVSAARSLADLERSRAAAGDQFAYGADHPFLNGVHRLTAARWLLEAGDTVSARRLLPWYEAVFPSHLNRLQLANEVLAAPALRLRWALADAAGREREAARFEARFRERWAANLAEAATRDARP